MQETKPILSLSAASPYCHGRYRIQPYALEGHTCRTQFGCMPQLLRMKYIFLLPRKISYLKL